MSQGQPPALAPSGSEAQQPTAEALAQPGQAEGACQMVRKEDLGCAICLETLKDPFVTACGHTFCYACLSQHLLRAKNCPACSHYLATDLIFPNFLLSKIVKRVQSRALDAAPAPLQVLRHAISDHRASLGEADVDALLQQLWELKQGMAAQQQEASMELLMHFLHSSREDKVQRLVQLQKELQCLDGDIQRVEAAGATAAGATSQQPGRPPSAGAGAAGTAAEGAGAGQEAAAQRDLRGKQQQGADGGVQLEPGRVPQLASVAAGAAAGPGQPGPANQQQPGDGGAAAAAAAVGQGALHNQRLFQLQQQAAGGGGGQPAAQHMLPPGPHAAGQASQLSHQQQHHQQQFASMFGSFMSPGAATSISGASSGGRPGGQHDVLSLLRNKKRRIASLFDDLQQCYLQLRANQLQAAAAAAAAAKAGGGEGGEGGAAAGAADGDAAAAEAAVGPLIDEGLQEFSRLLSVITRCNKLKLVAEVPRPSLRQSSSIISSLEFDKEGTLFATAGVSKRISIFDFASVAPTHPSPGVHAPAVELVSRSKLSCLSWNKYIQGHIASSDYEGVVSVWDVSTGALLNEFEAHSKRIWSVDFCEADPTLLASGSDDCAVKFWSTNCASSVAQVETRANVCAVRWRPGSCHELAVGSADHSVYLYDLRHTAQPLRTFQGHRKAVSYVRFCSSGELVSASTDSTLRLWGLEGPAGAVPTGASGGGTSADALRVYEGHSNEKNFVGLAVDGDFLACGSESSELYVYYKALSKPVAQQAFAALGEAGSGGGALESQSDKAFISAVCWRPGAQTLLAANSMGTVKVFSLTGSSSQLL